MPRTIALLLLLLTGPAPAAEPAVEPADGAPADTAGVRLEAWEIEGDLLLAREDVLASLPWTPGERVPPDVAERAAATLAGRLVESGWWGARVTGASRSVPDGAIVMLTIESGEPVVVGEIGVRGNALLTREEILARLEMRPGDPFETTTFRSDVARVLRAYSERGHPLARVYPSRFRSTAPGELSFELRISEGPLSEIESVRVFGETNTNERVITRISGVRPGDTWNVAKVERMAARLRREQLFTFVGEPRVVSGSRDNRIGIEIELEEGPSSSFLGVLGYNPEPDGGGVVVGQVDLRLHNILGTARKAELRFERQSRDTQNILFRYREPWILGSPLTVELGAAQERRAELYSRTDLEVAVSGPLGEHSEAILAGERRESSFDGADSTRVTESSTGGSAGLTVDVRDRRINPGRGWMGRLRVGGRQTETDELRTRLEGDGQVLLPLGRSWVLSEAGGYRGVRSTGPEVPLYEQYFLGGTNTVRGYREEQFRGERVWWVRSELRYRLSIRSRAYGFVDVGGYRFEEELPGGGAGVASDTIAGGGIGMSLETRSSGIVRVELALGRGDGFSDAKVHVALEQEF